MQKDESQISRQARWQRKHRAAGLCVLCSRPAYKGWRCKKHYEQHKITMRLRYIPKVRGRYKVSGTTETTKRKAAKPAARTTAKTTAKSAKPAKKTASRTATRTTARKSVKATAKTTARKSTARKTTTRRAAPKRAAKG
jgi:hypothetical protein